MESSSSRAFAANPIRAELSVRVILDLTPCRLAMRPQFPSKQITNDQDYYGCARYAEVRRSMISTPSS
jgi:hypothetical protein